MNSTIDSRSASQDAGLPSNTKGRQHSHRGDIDGLRALAVLAVIGNHIDHNLLPGGFLGVDMFFVISGFVITSSLLSRPTERFTDFLFGFYERRIRRIIPALACCVVLTFLVASLFITPNTTIASSTWQTGAWALLGVSNIYLGINASDYFASSSALNPFTQTWSLGVEEQFYLIYPLLFFATTCLPGGKANGRRGLLLAVGITGALSLAAYLLVGNQNSWPYYYSPLRFWELAAGCMACLLRLPTLKLPEPLRTLLPWLSLAICLGTLILAGDASALGTILTVLAMALLLASSDRKDLLYQALACRLLRPIGLGSYSLYLWHWSVLAIARWTIGISIFSLPWLLLAIGILSYASYAWIETPLRQAPWMGNKRGTFLIGFGASIAGVATLFALRADNGSQLYIGKTCKADRYETCTPPDSPHPTVTPHISNTSIRRNPCFVKTLETGLTAKVLKQCSAIRSPEAPTLYVVGDSFAGALSPAIDPIYNEGRFNLVYLAAPGCHFNLFSERKRRRGCSQFNKDRYELIKRDARPGDVVLVSATSGSGYSATSLKTLAKLRSDLASQNVQIVVQQIMPRLKAHIPDLCFEPRQAFSSMNPLIAECGKASSVSLNRYLENTKSARTELKKLDDGRTLLVWDPNSVICWEGRCHSHYKGIRLFRDTHHFSVAGAQRAEESLRSILRRTGIAPSLGPAKPSVPQQDS